jgi:hypothetical protein
MSAGIDYGMGKTNLDPKTGIRFGVIPVNALGQAWHDESEADYGKPTCPECEGEVLDPSAEGVDSDAKHHTGHGCDDWYCPECKHMLDSSECYPEQPHAWTLDEGEDGLRASMSGYDGVDVFVMSSPYFTRATYCSPCAPGACYLLSPNGNGDKAYCFGHDWFGHDWFEDGKAPYPVFLVASGEEIKPSEVVPHCPSCNGLGTTQGALNGYARYCVPCSMGFD